MKTGGTFPSTLPQERKRGRGLLCQERRQGLSSLVTYLLGRHLQHLQPRVPRRVPARVGGRSPPSGVRRPPGHRGGDCTHLPRGRRIRRRADQLHRSRRRRRIPRHFGRRRAARALVTKNSRPRNRPGNGVAKRNLDRFSRFSTTHRCVQQPDRHRPRYICSNRPHFGTICMRRHARH